MSEPIKHPRALAIAQKREGGLWEMGDYLIEIAGKPSINGHRDNSNMKIKEVSDELVAHGFPDYSPSFMSNLRTVAFTFSTFHRVKGVSWTAHLEARSPEVLQAVIAAAKEAGRDVGGRKAGEGISKRFVNQVLDGMEADERIKRKGLSLKAQRAADRAEAKGDKIAAFRNRERARKLKSVPKRDLSKRKVPTPEEVPLALVKAKFMSDSAEALALVRRMEREIAPHIDDMSKAFIVGSVEELLEIAERFRNLATKINRNQTNKRAHLHAVA